MPGGAGDPGDRGFGDVVAPQEWKVWCRWAPSAQIQQRSGVPGGVLEENQGLLEENLGFASGFGENLGGKL